jgi:hypothetical protein
MRRATLATRELREDAVWEKSLAEATFYRVAVEGQSPAELLSIPINLRNPSREALLLIHNQDNPPLQITSVSIRRQPVYLLFVAPKPGTFTALVGNKDAAFPRYDLGGLQLDVRKVPLYQPSWTERQQNPDYRVPEVLPEVHLQGAPLDVAEWGFRKQLTCTPSSIQQLELDIDVLAHASGNFPDLRIVSQNQQFPYLIEHTSLSRRLTPQLTAANDPKRPKVSRWMLQLPQAGLPLQKLTCISRTSLFRREPVLYEELKNQRGETYRRVLGQGAWVQTPGRNSKLFSIELSSFSTEKTVFLEIDNQDNPAIELENLEFYYPATRLLFKAPEDKTVFLYYGNPRAETPRYDLSLVAGQIFAAQKSVASTGSEQTLNGQPRALLTRSGGIIFWGILALVVVALLAVISRLLPRASVSDTDKKPPQSSPEPNAPTSKGRSDN